MKKILSFFSNLILLALCVYAIHDMQTAQGVGYYFCLKLGSSNRILFDVLADLVFCILLGVFLVIPVLFCKKNHKGIFSRYLILFLAFIPSVSTNYVFSLFFNTSIYAKKLNAIEWLGEVISSYSLIVPMLVLVMAYYCEIRKNKVSHGYKTMMIIAFLLVFPGLLIPGITTLCLYFGVYLLLYIIFDFLEQTNFDSIWLYGFLFFVAIYKIISVTAAWGIN